MRNFVSGTVGLSVVLFAACGSPGDETGSSEPALIDFWRISGHHYGNVAYAQGLILNRTFPPDLWVGFVNNFINAPGDPSEYRDVTWYGQLDYRAINDAGTIKKGDSLCKFRGENPVWSTVDGFDPMVRVQRQFTFVYDDCGAVTTKALNTGLVQRYLCDGQTCDMDATTTGEPSAFITWNQQETPDENPPARNYKGGGARHWIYCPPEKRVPGEWFCPFYCYRPVPTDLTLHPPAELNIPSCDTMP